MADRTLTIYLKNLATGVSTPAKYKADEELFANGQIEIYLDCTKHADVEGFWYSTTEDGEEVCNYPELGENQELKFVVTNLTGSWTYTQHNHIKYGDADCYLSFTYPKTAADAPLDPVVIGYKVVSKVPINYYGKSEDGKYKLITTEFASPNTIHKLSTSVEIDGDDFPIIPSYMGTPVITEKGADNGATVFKIRIGKSPVKVLAKPATEEEVLLNNVVVEEGNTTSNPDEFYDFLNGLDSDEENVQGESQIENLF